MKKQNLILIAIAFQVLAVTTISVSKEWILATGNEIILQTAPIDPRDIFRGDYVHLDYAISKISVNQLESDIVENGLNNGQKVYISLATDANDVAQGNRLYSSPPADVPYLKGYSTSHWPFRGYKKQNVSSNENRLSQPVTVKYGIEQFYVEQGHGLEMEKTRGKRNDFQVPMLMHIAVSGSGEALIRSFDWANIAMKTRIKQSAKRDAADNEASAIISFTLLNRSNQNMVLPLKADNCSFSLIPASTTPDANDIKLERTLCNDAVSVNRVIKPDEEITMDFDLNLPQWYISYKDKITPMGKLPWNYRFRIIYNDVTIKNINAKIVSQAFHGQGNID